MTPATVRSGKSIQDWESTFNRWSKGPSQTEQEKCDNAERMVGDAIRAHDALRNRNITIFAQGSYKNRTNVRAESDVDVCVLCMDTCYPDYSLVPELSNGALGLGPATYHFDEFKQDVEDALVVKFGRKAIKSGDKAFDVQENTYRVSADVVPTFEGRLYYAYGSGYRYFSGTVLQCSSDGRVIRNWPLQHYENGVQKHARTSRQFKKKVRCLKNLCNTMAAEGVSSAKKMASFLLESSVYNCPDGIFAQVTQYEGMKAVIAQLWDMTETDGKAEEMVEVNERKYLFRLSQPWKRSDVHQFLFDAWVYVGFASE